MKNKLPKNDGGPAFPCPWKNDGDGLTTAPNGAIVPPGETELLPGMTLRDYFAAKAMARVEFAEYYGAQETVKSLTESAKRCYRIADAMLEARK